MARVNGDMIVIARESRELTQERVAGLLSVTQATLSKYETGALAVSDEHLAALSKELAYPEAFFLLDEQVRWTGSGCMYNRKRQSLTAGEYKRLLARVNIMRLSLWRLLQTVEIGVESSFTRLDPAEFGTPEKIAAVARQAWNLPPGPIGNLTRAIEAAGGLVLKCDFGTNKLDAFAQWPAGMPPLFFVNRSAPPDRYRYTLAHEIGHMIMHAIPNKTMEREADTFAAEFLMPKRDIRAHLGRPFTLQKAAELKVYWKVAMSALIRRAHDLGTISSSYYRALMTQMSSRGYRLNEPVPLDPEEPSIVQSVIDVHLNDHGYSLDELSKIALLNPDDFAVHFPQPPAEIERAQAAKMANSRPYLRAIK